MRHFVQADPMPTAPAPSSPLPPLAVAVARTGSSTIRDLLEIVERPDVLSLAGGLPSPGAFPVDVVAAAAAEVLAADPVAALQYGATEGIAALRSWVADRMGGGTGADQVVITAGSQQALDLLGRALVDPGAPVVVPDPGYVGAIQALRSAGAELVGVPVDGAGLRTDVLADALAGGLRPALVYVVAELDNPTGTTLAEERRRDLAALADRYGFWVVEDDPYGELRWRGERGTPLRRLSERVVTLGTVSKVISPGLRVGWAVGPPELIRALVVLKQAADLHTSTFSQQVAHRVLAAPGFLDRHLPAVRARYRGQADVLVDAIRAELGDRLPVARPDGGMFLWGRLLDRHGAPVDTDTLLPEAVASGVAYVPASAFSVGPPQAGGLRLSFATGAAEDLREAVARLAAVAG